MDFLAHYMTGPALIAILQIIWIDLLLSGDNAVVIAMACRSLPPKQRRIGLLLGTGAAVGLRILFAVLISWLLDIPFLSALGGVLLLWIAVKLVAGEDDAAHDIPPADRLWTAVRTIAIADAAMSLDNVVAIVAIAKDDMALFIFGLLLSIPLIVAGASLVTNLIKRFPAIVWAGGALLGWIAGAMIGDSPHMRALVGLPLAVMTGDGHGGGSAHDTIHYACAITGMIFVIAAGWLARRRKATTAA